MILSASLRVLAMCLWLGLTACAYVDDAAPPGASGTAVPSVAQDASEGLQAASCTYDGVPLHGKVSIVDDFADFQVGVVTDFPDLRVQRVEHAANACGQWQIVEDFPDFTVRLVEDFPDFTIQFVDDFPGT